VFFEIFRFSFFRLYKISQISVLITDNKGCINDNNKAGSDNWQLCLLVKSIWACPEEGQSFRFNLFAKGKKDFHFNPSRKPTTSDIGKPFKIPLLQLPVIIKQSAPSLRSCFKRGWGWYEL